MDEEESHSTSQDSFNSREAVHITNPLFEIVSLPEVHCAFCETMYSPGSEANRHLNACHNCVVRLELYNEESWPVLWETQQRVEEALQSFAETQWVLEEELRQRVERRRQRVERRRQREENQRILEEETRRDSEEFRQRFEPHQQLFERCLECLPHLVITQEHEKKHNGLQCAICLDPLSVGSIVSQLPCFHFFHPLCIVPWLKVRMSCPTCRYKLSSAFQNETRQNSNRRIEFQQIVHGRSNVNSFFATYDVNDPEVVVSESYNETTDSSVRDREGSRGGWFLFAAAPIVSLIGIALVECFHSFLGEGRGRGSTCHVKFPFHCQQQVRMFSSGSPSTRTSNSRENN